MADRGTGREQQQQQPPPNPFLLSSTASFTTPAPSLFSRPQGAGTPPATTTTTTTGLFGLPTTTTTTAGSFGLPSTSGPFGLSSSAFPSASPFGLSNTTTTGPFGLATTTTTTTSSPFGLTSPISTTSSPFGLATSTTNTSPFGLAATTTTTSNPFGLATTSTTTAGPFGLATTTSSSSPFGLTNPASTTTPAGPFGLANTTTTTPAPGPFGLATTTTSSPFGLSNTTTTNPFGLATTTTTTSPFGLATSTTTTTPSPFGLASSASTTSPSPFGLSTTTTTTTPATPFTSLVFGPQATASDPPTLFTTDGTPTPTPATATATATASTPGSSIFGNAPASTGSVPSTLFGGAKRNVAAAAAGSTGSTKEGESGAGTVPPTAPGPSVFGGSGGGGVKGAAATTTASGIFRGDDVAGSVFGRSAGTGAEGQSGSFGLFKEPKPSEAGQQAPRVFGGQASASASASAGQPSASSPGKASTSFGGVRGRVKAERKEAVSPGSTRERKESQSTSPEINKKDVTKIIVANIPDTCLNKDILRDHFAKFGEIKRLVMNSQARQATVIYATHHDASRAKHKGRKLHPMLPEVKIYYGYPARRRSEETGQEAAQAKKKAIRTLQQVHQPSDLDPYLPLQRPGTEPPTPTPAPKRPLKAHVVRPARPKAEPPPALASTSQKLSLPAAPKKVRKKSPAGEAKEAAAASPTATAASLDDSNLPALLEATAQNNNDRYNILKARDKLLRRERRRTSDLRRASFLAATCPDMCPELERYMRDVQSDLSATFETTGGALDHRLVTKKFSRSSADKELPLPHELRPGPVLLRTMDFLVCNVISRVEEEGMEVDVWYNYLWNRTRAVRNDLMQQQLTDATAVAIMERCTRFHVYAAARLCEEPADLYDPKMNTEHLSKSLQTLKELYHDLGEQGQLFPSEAEFRGYEMLLSLNDGAAIVNKYAQFREEVQKSPEVQLALKVIQAVTFNNYVKFFRLVRESSTYLQGCLLHRYFRQVRDRALETMVRSYVSPKGLQNMPLHTFTRILGFENEVEAVAYLGCHGLRATGGTVTLDKHAFVARPEEPPPPVRPLLLVEKNRSVPVGEVIQGGPIPDNPLHTHVPHDSFDGQGRLKPGARDASDQSESPAVVPLGLGLAPVVQQPTFMQNYALVSHMKDVYCSVEAAVLPAMVKEVSTEVVEAARRDAAALGAATDLLAEAARKEAEAAAREGYREVEREEAERKRRQREEEERQRKALEEVRVAAVAALHGEYTAQFVDACVRQACEAAVWEVAEEVAIQELEAELPLRCVAEAVEEEAVALSREAVQEVREEQERRVAAFIERRALRSVAEHFRVWRLQTLKAHRRRQSQMTFPAACSGLSLAQQSQALGWGYARDPHHNMSALQVARLEDGVRAALKKLTARNQLMRERAWHPLPLQRQVAALAARLSPARHMLLCQYFKVLLCPSPNLRPEVMLWLRSKLGGQEGGQGQGQGQGSGQDILQPLNTSFSLVCQRSGLEYAWAVREVPIAALGSRDVHGAGLVLVVTSGPPPRDCSWEEARPLLSRLPRGAVCVINFEDCRGHGEGVAWVEDSQPWSLVEEDLTNPRTSDRLQSLLLEAWQRQGRLALVASSRLDDLANDAVVRHFLEPALKRHRQRLADGKSPLPPQALVDLYNSTLDTLQLAVANDTLASLSWPPPELAHLTQVPPNTWNSEDMQRASRLLAAVRLAPLSLDAPATTWAGLRQTLHRYATTLAGSSSGEAPVLASHMDTILSEAWASLKCFFGKEEELEEEEEEEGEEEALTTLKFDPLMAPWPQLIYACASYKLSGLPDTTVYYLPASLDHFPAPQSWEDACGAVDPGWWEAARDSHVAAAASRKRKAQREEEQEAGRVAKARTVHSQLLDDIAAEKLKCEEFEKNLENMLEVEEELRLLFNTSSEG